MEELPIKFLHSMSGRQKEKEKTADWWKFKTWVDIHNTVHKFITHPSSCKFHLPVLYSVKWHDKCNAL